MFLGYVAGFFDGEGCIHLSTRKNNYTSVVSVSQRVRQPLDLIQETFGGVVTWNGHVYLLTAFTVDQQKVFLEALLPHLIVKKQQAKLMLEFLNRKRQRGRRYTDEQRGKYDKICQELRDLKRGE